jgi:hypothetical protein
MISFLICFSSKMSFRLADKPWLKYCSLICCELNDYSQVNNLTKCAQWFRCSSQQAPKAGAGLLGHSRTGCPSCGSQIRLALCRFISPSREDIWLDVSV